MSRERIVAVGLLTQKNLDCLANSFERCWPVDETPCFLQLLGAIDQAGRMMRENRGLNQTGIPQGSLARICGCGVGTS